MARFSRFLAIDWSGAAGERHKGIALALADADGGPPMLVSRDKPWSRGEVLEHLSALSDDTLVGLDLGMSLPFADCGAFFPGWKDSPPGAKALWALVDRLCDTDPHFAAGGVVDHPELAAFFRRQGGREGAHFRCDGAGHGRGRFRATELAQAAMGCRPYSNFNLVGAAQVGKASLTGMRLLHRLSGRVAVWPFDPLPTRGPVVVEIYTTLAALAAGRSAGKAKMRSFEDLNAGLATLGSPPVAGAGVIDDHASDALLAAAWMRNIAHEPQVWSPGGLTRELARTEGWTFGAL